MNLGQIAAASELANGCYKALNIQGLFPPSPIENQTTIPGELEHSPQITRGPLFEYQNSLLERLVEVCTTRRDRV